jgi:hypothetical protein
MCHPTRCPNCGKTTWTGCGKHVADVRAGIPADQWCAGHDEALPDLSWLRRIVDR